MAVPQDSASLPLPPADPAPAAPAVPAQARNPLHGVTLEAILTALVAHYGWPGLAQRIPVRCFTTDPSVASSLKFLRKTPWGRDKVEGLYLFMLRKARRDQSHDKSRDKSRDRSRDKGRDKGPDAGQETQAANGG